MTDDGRAETDEQTELLGIVTEIRFRDRADGWSPGYLLPEGARKAAAVVGKWNSTIPGAKVRLIGRWNQHPKWGPQFAFDVIEMVEEASPEDEVASFLEFRCPEIGPIRARQILEAFGADTCRVIEEEPERLALKIRGITRERALTIQTFYREYKHELELARQLRKWQLAPHVQAKVIKTWNKKAIEKLEADPFHLYYEIEDVGFLTADKARQAAGIGERDPRRLRAVLVYVIEDKAEAEGSTYLGEIDALNLASVTAEMALSEIAEALQVSLDRGYLVRRTVDDKTVLYRAVTDRHEAMLAASVNGLLAERMEDDGNGDGDEQAELLALLAEPEPFIASTVMTTEPEPDLAAQLQASLRHCDRCGRVVDASKGAPSSEFFDMPC